MGTKNDIKFHTEVPDQPPGSETFSKRPMLKGILYILLTFAITYFAKVSPPQYSPSREHGFLSWTFPTSTGISVLWVLADDGIDTNGSKTGHRIWIDPPRHPLKTTENHLKLQGRSMTVISETIERSTILELSQLLPHQSDLQLGLPQEAFQELSLWVQENGTITLSDSHQINLQLFEIKPHKNRLQFSLNEFLVVEYTQNKRQIRLSYADYQLLHHTGSSLPESKNDDAMVFWNRAPQDSLEAWATANLQQTLVSHGNDVSFSKHHLILQVKPIGAASYEEEGMMHLRKLIMPRWEAQNQ